MPEQTTLQAPASVAGTGLHTGTPVRVSLRPAPAGSGIVFHRLDAPEGTDPRIPARWDRALLSPLATRLANGSGLTVSTVEHLMAALVACGVHNALVELDGPEVPILDGSAAPWVEAIRGAGTIPLDAPLEAIEILEPVEVRDGEAVARLDPHDGFAMRFAIDFPDAAIGRQSKALDLGGQAVLRELADSRTFCRQADVERMRSMGLALGGTYLNAVVVEGARVLSPGGLRHPDEAVRHKMLDAVGDLALAGAPILGLYTGRRSGHALTARLLTALFSNPDAWRRILPSPAQAARLPGAGVGRAHIAPASAAA